MLKGDFTLSCSDKKKLKICVKLPKEHLEANHITSGTAIPEIFQNIQLKKVKAMFMYI